ncbi:MAG: hypothetical protein ACOY4Q_02390 [Bacillota bacterium]
MNEIIKVYRRELLKILYARSIKKQAIGWFVFLLMFGIAVPFSQAGFWLKETSLLSLHFLFVPLMLTYTSVADSFAGEKERRTMGGALAAGVSEDSLFFGKALAGFIFSFTFYMIVVFIGILTLNYYRYISGTWQGFYVYSPPVLFTFVFIGAALTVFAVGSGVLVSLKVGSVKNAQLVGSLVYLVIGIPLMAGWLPVIFTWEFVIPVFAALLAIDALVILLAARLFRRAGIIAEG